MGTAGLFLCVIQECVCSISIYFLPCRDLCRLLRLFEDKIAKITPDIISISDTIAAIIRATVLPDSSGTGEAAGAGVGDRLGAAD